MVKLEVHGLRQGASFYRGDMDTIYIVFGTTGEYSDRTEWPVAAYADKAQAETHVTLAESWERLNGRDYSRLAYDRRSQLVNPYDPGYTRDYTGTSYSVGEVPLRTEVPQDEVKG